MAARVIVVTGTGTGVGKTFVTAALAATLRSRGLVVAARKPVQSHEPAALETDVERLARATTERADEVGEPTWSYPLALAPPMAAALLGRVAPRIEEIASFVRRVRDGVEVVLVECVGGVRSPFACDGDSVDFVRAVRPQLVVVVSEPELGVISSVRLSADALAPARVVVQLNRYDEDTELHRLNCAWLNHDGYRVSTSVSELADIVLAT